MCYTGTTEDATHNPAEKVIDFVDDCTVDSEERDISTQYLQMQKDQLFDLQNRF